MHIMGEDPLQGLGLPVGEGSQRQCTVSRKLQ